MSFFNFISTVTLDEIKEAKKGKGDVAKVDRALEDYAEHLLGDVGFFNKSKIIELFPTKDLIYSAVEDGGVDFELYKRINENHTPETIEAIKRLHAKVTKPAYDILKDEEGLYDLYTISVSTNIPFNNLLQAKKPEYSQYFVNGASSLFNNQDYKKAILSHSKIPVQDKLYLSKMNPNYGGRFLESTEGLNPSSAPPPLTMNLVTGHMLVTNNKDVYLPPTPRGSTKTYTLVDSSKVTEAQKESLVPKPTNTGTNTQPQSANPPSVPIPVLDLKNLPIVGQLFNNSSSPSPLAPVNSSSTTQTLYDVSSPTGVAIPKNVHHSLLPLNNQDWTGHEDLSPEQLIGNNFVRAGNITYIHDGDTVHVGSNKNSIRLAGIDTPEKQQSPYGEQSRKVLESLLKDRNIVIKVLKLEGKGRFLGILYDAETGENINVEMVKRGAAFAYKDYLEELEDKDLINSYIEAEALAKSNSVLTDYKGSIHHPDFVKPWDYRKVKSPGGGNSSVDATVNTEGHGSPFDDEALEYAEDHEMSTKSPYEHMHGEASIAHLSRLYDSYYSSADVKVWMKVEGSSNKVMVDLLTGIGYSLSSNSMPVYTIGSRFPIFFTRGNTIGNGTLVVPFKHAKYLRAMLKYVFDESDTGSQSALKKKYEGDPDKATDEDFLNEVYTGEIDEGDIIDVGAVVTPFDLEIRFDNSNAFGRDQHKSKIILKGCKLTGESTDVASTRDGAIQVGYNFLFKTAVSGDAYEYIS